MFPLAQTGTKRSSLPPDVPTLQELGYAGIPAGTYLGLVAPRGTPAPAIAHLQQAVKDFLLQPRAEQELANAGFDAHYLDASAFGREMQGELKVWADAVAYSGVKRD